MLSAIVVVGSAVTVLYSPYPVLAQSDTVKVVREVSVGFMHGHLNGTFPGRRNTADWSVLEPGDVVLCHNPGGSYGYWTHAVLYVGHGQVLDANDFVRGTVVFPVMRYNNYETVEVLRAEATADKRWQIAADARRELGKAYDPFSSLEDTKSEYCSKLIWYVYHRNGMTLCPPRPWLLPDHLAQSPALVCVGQWSAERMARR